MDNVTRVTIDTPTMQGMWPVQSLLCFVRGVIGHAFATRVMIGSLCLYSLQILCWKMHDVSTALKQSGIMDSERLFFNCSIDRAEDPTATCYRLVHERLSLIAGPTIVAMRMISSAIESARLEKKASRLCSGICEARLLWYPRYSS